MGMRRTGVRWLLLLALPALLLVAACGSGSGTAAVTTVSTTAAVTKAAVREAAAAKKQGAGDETGLKAVLTSWPEFGFDPQRSDATESGTGITAGNLGKLRDRRVTLPGTIDSSLRAIQTWSHSSPFELCIVVRISAPGVGSLLSWRRNSSRSAKLPDRRDKTSFVA